ncbi:hypothetical protein [uncultured Salinicola sp.]|uniref:hypothetical protein n=1 Tax=uncultured Salinicola sp. TaxID=1193542 RepID=UPI00260CBB5A|nr:hypothetical protein [uncultured Salinicola sp.]|tara:strand:- start:671 stop:1063 length:393 start_codon:yes stop_codon:yes gene_type:complete
MTAPYSRNIRIDVTTKAQCRGLCPQRRDVMVMMEQPLINEVAMLVDAPVHDDILLTLHWLDRLDAFIDQAREGLAAAPEGSRSFDFDITAIPSTGDWRQPLRLEIHAEIERRWNKHALVFSLAGRQSLAA